MTATVRRLPWSLLQTQWLDLPIGGDPGHGSPTWAALSESLERCLWGVSLHVSLRVGDRQCLEDVVTEVVVENLRFLVSQLGEREKLDRLLGAADHLIARRAAARATDARGPPPRRLPARSDAHSRPRPFSEGC